MAHVCLSGPGRMSCPALVGQGKRQINEWNEGGCKGGWKSGRKSGKADAESECAPSAARSVGKVIAPEVIL